MTEKRESFSYARALIEVDIAKELVTEVYIQLPKGKTREQDVIYENMPKFCPLCKMLGHSIDGCKKKEQEVKGGKQKERAQKQLKGASNAEFPKESAQTEGEQAREPHKETAVPTDHPPARNNPVTTVLSKRAKEGNTMAQGDNIDDKDQGRHLSQNSTHGLAATRRLVNDEEEEELETTPKSDKGVLIRITSILVDKGSKKTTGKDKGKMLMGKNKEKGLEKRKDWKVAHNFFDHKAGRIAIIWDPRRASLDFVETNFPSNTCHHHMSYFSQTGRQGASIILRGTGFHDMLCGLGTSRYQLNGDLLHMGKQSNMFGFRKDYANARILPSGFISDNSSCVVSLFEEPKIHKPSFMFLNMWCEHDLFVGLVEYTLCYKLKKLKRSLKDLNKKHYGHISAKAEAVKSELKQKHEELHDNPHDE
ncbi:hypothetical protein M9H77_35031 [Catharanthus roseus]|uniref:Uncharacterized protein n=1 Tax=Catharanthus roseus TaxID=4058 RepID=A0ACB9ZMU8_CATRO|nr:hypothetical protein M9H77_35031 [Catharanthus roseus]